MKQDERELLTRAAVKARLMVDFKCELMDFLFVLVFCLLWGWMLFSLLAAVSGALLVILLLFELPVFLWALAALYFEEHGRCTAPKRTVDHATPGEHFYLVLDQKGRALYAYHTEIYRLAA